MALSKGSYSSNKAVAVTNYKDYIEFLRGPKSDVRDITTFKPGLALATDGAVVCDRFFYCEIPYATVFRKEQRTQFTLKQWHNMHLSTIAFNPVVVLATRKANVYKDQVPEELFGPILESYKQSLALQGIHYYKYDWKENVENAVGLLRLDEWASAKVSWWREMARAGVAGVGNTVAPRAIIIAQDLGPSNIHRIAFEQGPSGYYLSDLIDEAEIPLSSFYLTNWVKTPDKEKNVGWLNVETEHLSQAGVHVVLLGRTAEESIPVLKNYIPTENIHTIRHPGWVVNHSGTTKELNYRKEKYLREWKELWKTILS